MIPSTYSTRCYRHRLFECIAGEWYDRRSSRDSHSAYSARLSELRTCTLMTMRSNKYINETTHNKSLLISRRLHRGQNVLTLVSSYHHLYSSLEFILFSMTSLSGCGGELTHINGTFASPNYPGTVTSAVTCSWTIRTLRGHLIKLQLFVLPSNVTDGIATSGGNCDNSYVAVYGGDEPSAVSPSGRSASQFGRFCTTVSCRLTNVMYIINLSQSPLATVYVVIAM